MEYQSLNNAVNVTTPLKSQNINNENNDNIKVIIRIRPKIEREYSSLANNIITDNSSLIIQTRKEKKYFTFDYIANEDSSQSEIFTKCAKDICDSILEGYNGTIFVYGQTGAGKTYTLLGPKFSNSNEPFSHVEMNSNSMHSSFLINQGYLSYIYKKEEEGKGILPRAIEYLFYKKEKLIEDENESDSNVQTTIEFECSFLEIYQEQISDLLDNNHDKSLIIRDLNNGVFVENLSKIKINSQEEAYSLIREGIKYRHIASTNMNKESSRSHAVFSLYVTSKSKYKSTNKIVQKHSVFHLIDLAGSERQKHTKCEGIKIKEAGKINKSLMQLSHVIKNLSEIASRKKTVKVKSLHIHYRDSKLTHLLKDSLGGNAKTCIIANISPATENLQETLSTLIFAQNAKLIKNKAIINEELNTTLFMDDMNHKINNEIYDEMMRTREQFNSIKNENAYLLSIVNEINNERSSVIQINKNNLVSMYKKYKTSSEIVEGEIDNYKKELRAKEKELSLLKESIFNYKKTYTSKEYELKAKDIELQEIKTLYKEAKNEYDSIKTKLIQTAIDNAYSTRTIMSYDFQKEQIEKELEQILLLKEQQLQEKENLIEAKENIIESIIKENESIVNTIQNITLQTEQKENEFLHLQEEQDKLIKEIEQNNKKISSIESDIKGLISSENENNLIYKSQLLLFKESFEKGKTLVKEYKNKIKTLNFQKLKAVENKNFMLWNYELKEKELNNLKEEIRTIKNKINFNKDTLINQLTSQFSQMELSNKELNVTVQNLKDDFMKYNKTFEMYSANTNKHNNKEALLITLNRENNEKLDEKHLLEQTINKLKQFFKNKKNEPVDITEISLQNENDLRNIKAILLTNIGKMKNELENNKYIQNTDNNDNLPLKRQFEKYYAQFKTLLSKQNRELEYLKEINVKKEAQIASLNRKIENIKQEIYFKSPHKSITDTKIKFNKLSFSPSKQIES